MIHHTFPKEEHLCGKIEFELVFKEGKAYYSSFLALLVRKVEAPAFFVHVGVIAPKKKIHHAVDRNRMKRLLREAYRLQKPSLYAAFEGKNFGYNMLFVCSRKGVYSFSEVNQEVCLLLSKLKKTATE